MLTLEVINNKFSVPCSNEGDLDVLRNIQTSRKKARHDVMTFTPCIFAVRDIEWYIEENVLDPTEAAAELILNIRRDYKKKRREIRVAEAKFKRGENVLPVPLKTLPYLHQGRCFGFCSSLDHSALLMDQGTGKTLVAIALIGYRHLEAGVTRVLVVCPKPVLPVWPRELEKHADFPYQLTCHHKFKVPDAIEGLSIWVINYDKIRTNEKAIRKWDPEHVILDESHKIKNHTAKRSASLHRIARTARYKNILTGTVLGQSPLDVFSQYLFLNPDVFGPSYSIFKEEYAKMGGFKGYVVQGYKNLGRLAEKIHSIAFRTTKEECLDLPEKSYQNIYCELSPKSKKIYQSLLKDFKVEIDGHEIEVDRVIAQMAKLRQITGGGVLSADSVQKLLPISSEKISSLKEVLECREPERKTIIFVAFTHEIVLISKLLEDMGKGFLTLQGSTPQEDRNTIEERFRKDSRYGIVLAQVSTGAEGLDFTAADMAIFYSPTFSFIHYAQACARIHRIGQTLNVTYINLIMEGTIDEQLVEFLQDHSSLSSELLDNRRNYKLDKAKPVTKEEEQTLDVALEEIKQELEDNTPPEGKMAKKKTLQEAVNEGVIKEKKVRKPRAQKVPQSDEDKSPVKVVNGYTAKMLAEEFGLEASELRKYLRAAGAVKPGKSWIWAKKTDIQLKELRPVLKGLIKDAASKEKASDKAAKPTSKKSVKPAEEKSTKKSKKKAK